MIASHVKEMADAISANVDYLKDSQVNALYLKNGLLVQQQPGVFVYRFDSNYVSKVDLDYQFDVLIGRDNYLGRLVALTPESIDIGLTENLGQTIGRAEISIGNYHLLEKLKDKLLEDKDRPSLGDELIGVKSPRESSNLDLANLEQIGSGLNQYQREALNFVDRNNITYIWGPPGTGKTQTIASIIESLISNNLNALLLSHTNIATDEALLKVARQFRGRQNTALDDGRVVRVGKIQQKHLLEEFGPKVTIDGIAAEKLRELEEKVKKHQANITQTTNEIKKLEQIKAKLAEHHQLTTQVQTLRDEVTKKQARIEEIQQRLVQLEPEIETTRHQIQQAGDKTGWSKIVGGYRLRKLQQLETKLVDERQTLGQESTRLQQELATDQETWDQTQTKLADTTHQLDGWNSKQIEQQLEELKTTIKQQRRLIETAEKQKEAVADSIIDNAQLIATTLTNSHLHPGVISRNYDCVIIDEASMAPLPAVWYAAGLARKRLVIVGDFCQLPPIVNYKSKGKEEADRMVEKWLKTSIFQTSGIEKAIEDESLPMPGNLVVLREQHRMPKEIADMVNHMMYGRFRGGEFSLITNGQQTTQSHEVLAGQKFGIIDTSKPQPTSGRSGSNSPYCIFNAALIMALVDHALKSNHQSIGVATAYRAQANLLQMMLKDKDVDPQKVEANTIHKFQGGERDLIIFDITVDYSKSMYERESAARLINVALSRTRQECLIIGNCQAIAKNHGPTSPTKKMLDYVRSSGRPILDVTEIMERLMPAVEAGLDPEGPLRLVSDQDFYPQFIGDINQAQKEIAIVSPFLKLDRCQSMIDHLRPALARGVVVFIITRRPPYGGFKTNTEHQQSMEALEKAGLGVLPIKENMHEKLALIDRDILWSGSLNIMSHKNSTDLMWRMTKTPEMIKQIMGFYRLDKNIPEAGSNPLEKCTKCLRPGAWFWNGPGKYGPYTSCLLGWHKKT